MQKYPKSTVGILHKKRNVGCQLRIEAGGDPVGGLGGWGPGGCG